MLLLLLLLMMMMMLCTTVQHAEVALQLQQCKVKSVTHFSTFHILAKFQLKFMNVGCNLLKIYIQARTKLYQCYSLRLFIYHQHTLADWCKNFKRICSVHRSFLQSVCFLKSTTLWFKKNAPTSADYNYDPVQSILIIFSKLFLNNHKSCLVVKFST